MATQIVEKVCTTCKTTKSTDEFHRDGSRKSGFRSACRSCEKIRRNRPDQVIVRKRASAKYYAVPENRKNANAYRKGLRLHHKSLGLCITCGTKPARPGMTGCVDCAERTNQYRKTRTEECIQNGICDNCFRAPKLPTGQHCETCYFRRASRRHLGSERHWQLLRDKLVAQNFRCPYTNELLVVGVNTSVDHIQPSSRFPELRTDPNNVEWVALEVNHMKRNRTPDEFLAIVEVIAKYRLR